ncbi:MAG: thioesterase family protein [Pseudolabrys sp.]|nr:thioesterase family protein [Pseudolabrys sp.]MDP2295945.1 thioesterase family protein [Pseudolabrys sp.]
MSDPADPELPAPFVSSTMRIQPQWIDFNGHLNMAYYVVFFDQAVDELYERLGLGPNYLKTRNHSTMVAEMHVRYLREVKESDPLRVRCQLLAYDAKRIHLFEELVHATEGWVSATCETITLHVDMAAKKVAPSWPGNVLTALERLQAAHAGLPVPESVGRRVAMPEKRA